MPVCIRYFTDPACSASWASEPLLRRLMVEFGADLSFTYVMGGLARDYLGGDDPDGRMFGRRGKRGLVQEWLDASERSGMPVDPGLWSEAPIRSTYPACMAVKAAAEQPDGASAPPEGQAVYRYLRRLREGLMCFRRKLDTTEALVEQARLAGLSAERFRIDLESHATVEAFGADLDEARDLPDEASASGAVVESDGRRRVPLPTMAFAQEAGDTLWVFGERPYDEYRGAAIAAGAQPSGEPRPGTLEALRRFGPMAAPEVEAVCDLPGVRANAELWQLASEWRVRPVPVLAGWLWELA
jgi:putative protein-disulfide isomerase